MLQKLSSFLIILIITTTLQAQDMLSAQRKWMKRYHFAVGGRAGEPTGINMQLHRGTACSFIKSHRVYVKHNAINLNAGLEGMFFKHEKLFKGGKIIEGGIKGSLSYFFYAPWPLQFYAGIGVQAGTHKYKKPDNIIREQFSGGGVATLGTEIRIFYFKITKHSVIFNTLFAEAEYYQSAMDDFYYLFPSGGLRINFY